MALLDYNFIMGVNYWEVTESGTGTMSHQQGQLSRTFLVSWSVHVAFIDALLGSARLDMSNVNDIKVNRFLPDEHPYFPSYFVSEVSYEPLGVSSRHPLAPTAQYPLAKVTATYGHFDFKVRLDDSSQTNELYRFVSRKATFTSELFTVQGQMKFVTSGNILNIPPTKLIGATELQYTWHQVPTKPVPAPPVTPTAAQKDNPYTNPCAALIKDRAGKINVNCFDNRYRPYTVMFLGAEDQQLPPRPGDIQRYFNITYKFLIRDNGNTDVPATYDQCVTPDPNEAAGHQAAWDQPNNKWDIVTSTGASTGARLYQTADLNELFTIDDGA